jgi:hypothetical protein
MVSFFKEIFYQKETRVNDKKLLNQFYIFEKISHDKNLCSILSPKQYSLTHDDLTVENILISNERDFIFLDPRGIADTQKYRDYIYDLAKLTCTLQAFTTIKYNKHKIMINNKYEYELNINTNEQNIYAVWNERVYCFLKSNINLYMDDSEWYNRLLFTEACHYLADVPCRIYNGDSFEVVLGIYLQGLLCLNNAYKRIV